MKFKILLWPLSLYYLIKSKSKATRFQNQSSFLAAMRSESGYIYNKYSAASFFLLPLHTEYGRDTKFTVFVCFFFFFFGHVFSNWTSPIDVKFGTWRRRYPRQCSEIFGAISPGTAKLWPWTRYQIDFSEAPYGGICVFLTHFFFFFLRLGFCSVCLLHSLFTHHPSRRRKRGQRTFLSLWPRADTHVYL